MLLDCKGQLEIPSAGNCSQYYICEGDNVTAEDWCGAGLIFNPDRGICADPSEVKCASQKNQG